jgi:4-hydroxy-tetrahydrodipicolinate reductase
MAAMRGSKSLRIAVLGAGRMGRELVAALARDEGAMLSGVWARDDGARLLEGATPAIREALGRALIGPDLDAVLMRADVAVDFTLPGATPAVLDSVARRGKPLVCGVSGLDDALMERLRAVAASVPVFQDRNMSFGIAVLTDLVARAAAALGAGFAAEVHETHHVHKIDAPSGTALKLGEALAAARGADFAKVFRYDEQGAPPRESSADIVFHVRREGEVPGEHTVVFRSDVETVELAHRVTHRRVFAEGALRAAKWLTARPPGLYHMRDLAEQIATIATER